MTEKTAVREKIRVKEKSGFFENEANIRKAEYLVRFMLSLVLAEANIFGDRAPFGAAMTAAAGKGWRGFFSMAGAITGYILRADMAWALKYICTAALIFSAAMAFRDTEIYKKELFMPGAAGAMTAITGLPYVIDAGGSLISWVMYLTEITLTGSCAYFYALALEPKKSRDDTARIVSLMLLSVTLISALSGIRLFAGISLGRLIACLAVMTAAWKYGPAYGCAAGAAAGATLDMAASGPACFSLAYGAGGLIAGAFSQWGRLLPALAFIITHAAAIMWTRFSAAAPLYEAFCASVTFMVLPGRAISAATSLISGGGRSVSTERARENTGRRIKYMAEAFASLSGAMNRHDDYDGALAAAVIDGTTEKICVQCPRAERCWKSEYDEIGREISAAAEGMIERGELREEDMSENFREKCERLSDFCREATARIRAGVEKRRLYCRENERRSIVQKQYGDISRVLSDAAAELSAGSRPENGLERRLKKYLYTLGIEAETAVFRNAAGRLYAEMSGAGIERLKRDGDTLEELSAVLRTHMRERTREGAENTFSIMEAEPLSVVCGVSSLKKEGEAVSGDKGTYFTSESGVFHIILSDGMGSGAGAARESGQAIAVLEGFLKAGMSSEEAMSLLNSSLLIKNGDEPLCAAVDLMSVDLFTGEAVFCKYGAAPSFVKRGKTVECIRGESMAAGLLAEDASAPDVIKMMLPAGSVAVILSDGVLSDGDEWLQETLEGDFKDTGAPLARAILEKAVGLYGCRDDMTVLTVSVRERR